MGPINPSTGHEYQSLYVVQIQRALTRLHEQNRAIPSPGALDGRWGNNTATSYGAWQGTLTNPQRITTSPIQIVHSTPQRVFLYPEGYALLNSIATAYAQAHPAEEVPIPPPPAPAPAPASPGAPVLVPRPEPSVPVTIAPDGTVLPDPWYKNPLYWAGGAVVLAAVGGLTWYFMKGKGRGRRGRGRRRR